MCDNSQSAEISIRNYGEYPLTPECHVEPKCAIVRILFKSGKEVEIVRFVSMLAYKPMKVSFFLFFLRVSY